VTKSGANTLHGDAFLFGQSGVVNARPKLDGRSSDKPSLRRYRGGLAVGGALAKNRTFYYAAAEREQTHDQAESHIDPDAMSSINGALSTGLFPQLATRHLTAGLFPTALTETEWSAKITRELAGRGALVARVGGTDSLDENDAFNTEGLSDVSARDTATTRDVGLTSSWTTTLGTRATNDLHGQFASRRLSSHSSDQQGAGVAGVAAFGTPYAGNSTHDQTYIELGDTVAYSRASRFVRAGADIRHVAVIGRTVDGIRGIYLFPTPEKFLAGQPDEARHMSAAADVDFATTRASAFVQDHWTPKPDLTIDAGARFDASVLPRSLGMTNRQVSPRLGLAWSPGATWVVRGGAGVFADRLVLAAVERAWVSEQRQVVERIADNSFVAAPSLYTVRSGPWNSASRQVSIGVERQLTSDLTASINYLLVQRPSSREPSTLTCRRPRF
jgi:hypothetical protein